MPSEYKSHLFLGSFASPKDVNRLDLQRRNIIGPLGPEAEIARPDRLAHSPIAISRFAVQCSYSDASWGLLLPWSLLNLQLLRNVLGNSKRDPSKCCVAGRSVSRLRRKLSAEDQSPLLQLPDLIA